MRILVTGANGFLGAEVARQLSEAGTQVRTTGRQTTPVVSETEYRQVDLRHLHAETDLTAGINTVVHAAGLAHQFGAEMPAADAYFEVNVRATERLLRASLASGVRHFVFVSSVSVYGNEGASHALNEDVPCQPHGPYAESKYQAEQLVSQFANQHGMNWTILRMATIYGPGDVGNIQRLMKAIDRRRFLWIGDGSNRKSLVHVRDAARACAAVIENAPKSHGKIWNVVGDAIPMRDIVAGLAQQLGRRTLPLQLPGKLLMKSSALMERCTGSQGLAHRVHSTLRKWLRDDIYDGSRLREQLTCEPPMPITAGLASEVQWYREGRAA